MGSVITWKRREKLLNNLDKLKTKKHNNSENHGELQDKKRNLPQLEAQQ